MALLTDVSATPESGLNHIDALLADGPGWNWLTPAREVIYYSFSVASGNEVGNSAISGGVTSFNALQKNACLSQLAYISQLTGITFAATTNGAAADLHFANTDIVTNANSSGLCSWSYKYTTDGGDTVTSYSSSAYVYLDNVEWGAQNVDPTLGNAGYETLLHELGHAMGLKHPFEGDITLPTGEDNSAHSIMSYTRSGGLHSTFSPYDVAALMWLYGGDGLGGSLGVSTSGVYTVGNASDEQIHGGNGNDIFFGEAGNDRLDGGSGIDTAGFNGNRAAYTLSRTGSAFVVNAKTGTDGTDTLITIERLQFADQRIAVDLGTSGNAGQAMAFIGAVAPDLLNTTSVRGTIISLFDQGQSMETLSQLALNLQLLPTSSSVDLANAVHQNVKDESASPEMTNALVDYIESYGQANFLATVAGLHLNVDLVGLQQTGVAYLI